jgi:hypothetical protein
MIKHIAILNVFKFIYLSILKIKLRTMAEMPQVKLDLKERIDNFKI